MNIVSKRMLQITIAVSIAAFGVGCFLVQNIMTFFLGVFWGILLILVKTVILERDVERAINSEKKNGENIMKLSFLLRYVLTAVVLVVAAVVPFFDLLGTIIVVVAFQLSAYFVKFVIKNNDRNDVKDNI